MKKKTKILIALVLVLCLTIPFRTIRTEASGTTVTVTNYDDLYVAVDSAHDGDTIIIGAVIPIEWGIFMNDSRKNITLQRSGNGKIQFVNPMGEYYNSFWYNFIFDCQGVSAEEFFDTNCDNVEVILTDCNFINTPASEPETDPPTEGGEQPEGGTGDTGQTENPSTDSGQNEQGGQTEESDTGQSEGGQEDTGTGSGEGSTDSGSDSSGTSEEGQNGQQEGTQTPSDNGQTEGEGTLTPPSNNGQEDHTEDQQTGTEQGTGETVPSESEQPESGNQEGTQQPSDNGSTVPPSDNQNQTEAPDNGETEAPNTQPSDSTLEEPQQGGTEQGNNTQPEQGQNGQGDTINNYVTNDNTVTNNDNRVTYYTTESSGTGTQTTPTVMTVPSGSNVTIFINGEQVELKEGQEGLTITINAGQTEEETEALTEEPQSESNYLTGNIEESEDLSEGVEGHSSSFSWSMFFDIIQTILLFGIVLILLSNRKKKN